MGFLTGVTHSLFGGKSEKSESGNLNNDFILSNYGNSGAGAYNQATGALSSALGSSPEDFFNNGGGKFLLNQGLDALTSKFSSLGLTHSGAAMKGMEDYRQGLADTFLQNYISDYLGLGDLGVKGGGLVASAGEYSKGKGDTETGRLGKGLGVILGRLAFGA